MSWVKAKLVRYHYLEETDTIFWDVKLENGEHHTLMWKRTNFGPSFNFKHSDIPIEMIKKFSDDRIGKDHDIDIGGAGPIDPAEIL
jgi:hypothetical protein